jgi:AraC-like DNA-binding protein
MLATARLRCFIKGSSWPAGLHESTKAMVCMTGSQTQRITPAIDWLRRHYAEPLRVDTLADAAHMSASTLHQRFKAVTAMSPLQFQKRLRLHEARRLMLTVREPLAFQPRVPSSVRRTAATRSVVGADRRLSVTVRTAECGEAASMPELHSQGGLVDLMVLYEYFAVRTLAQVLVGFETERVAVLPLDAIADFNRPVGIEFDDRVAERLGENGGGGLFRIDQCDVAMTTHAVLLVVCVPRDLARLDGCPAYRRCCTTLRDAR